LNFPALVILIKASFKYIFEIFILSTDISNLYLKILIASECYLKIYL